MDEQTKEKLKNMLPDKAEHQHLANAKKVRQGVVNPMGKVEDVNHDETLIADIRRHPIGLFFIYLQGLAAIFAMTLIIVFLVPSFSGSSSSDQEGAGLIAVLLLFLVSLLAVAFLFIATRIYTANQLIVTSDNVTQVRQIGLFNRTVSEVSMENIEDVSAHQEGILSTIFNYGRVHIETAGEQDNYNFRFSPNPNAYAKAIQDARVEFLKKKHK